MSPSPHPSPDPRPRVTFQGELGAFSEEAVAQYFSRRADPVPCKGFQEAVERVASGAAEYGMIPVENSLAGSVAPAYDALMRANVEVVSELIRPIRHVLMGIFEATLEGLRQVRSHPVALAQCTGFLGKRRHLQAVAVYDTAGAAREVARQGDPTVAAIAPEGAAERYGLKVLATDLQDRMDNQTRFYLIRSSGPGGTQPQPHPAVRTPDATAFKTVIVVELSDETGSLFSALEPFAREGLSLSKIESRPASLPWSYRFILEVREARTTPAMTRALAELQRQASEFRVLGSFPTQAGPAGGATS